MALILALPSYHVIKNGLCYPRRTVRAPAIGVDAYSVTLPLIISPHGTSALPTIRVKHIEELAGLNFSYATGVEPLRSEGFVSCIARVVG